MIAQVQWIVSALLCWCSFPTSTKRQAKEVMDDCDEPLSLDQRWSPWGCIQVSILEQDPSLFAYEGMVQAIGPCLRHGLGDKWNLGENVKVKRQEKKKWLELLKTAFLLWGGEIMVIHNRFAGTASRKQKLSTSPWFPSLRREGSTLNLPVKS